MTKIKPSLPKGTRDFLPQQVARRKYIFNTIRDVFEKYGFVEIETPAFERLETLTGKYGEEGDRLLFKILNSGDFLSKASTENLTTKNSAGLLKEIAEKGLRYDLTVPLARYVVQHQSELVFPFKRYHVGPVWRADKPQKGRYQEFFQFDADVIGADSLLNDVELTMILLEVYQSLGMDVSIKMNNRKLLEALSIYAGCPDQLMEITVAIDKLDKIGAEGVNDELQKLSLTVDQISKINEILHCKDLSTLSTKLSNNTVGEKGIEELTYIFSKIKDAKVSFDITLARGLTYYTGTIWEVLANNVVMGSITGGGRYDNLTEMFGGQNMSGVGISFGIERIYDVMEELHLFPNDISKGVDILFVAREEHLMDFVFEQVSQLRAANISCEMYTGHPKKKFNYAEAKQIGYFIEVGDDEKESGIFRVKNMSTREEEKLSIIEIITKLKK
jgi:histidyl-tRNA synthetase